MLDNKNVFAVKDIKRDGQTVKKGTRGSVQFMYQNGPYFCSVEFDGSSDVMYVLLGEILPITDDELC